MWPRAPSRRSDAAETLEVRGQQADIMQISYAQVTLDIENASSTVVELLV